MNRPKDNLFQLSQIIKDRKASICKQVRRRVADNKVQVTLKIGSFFDPKSSIE